MKRRIAILTSGGDAPGMNAAIRAVTRLSVDRGWEVFGVRAGFEGLISGDMQRLGTRDVGGIMHLGGTILGSARSARFREPAGQREALNNLQAAGIDGLVVIGGNGSQQGAVALHRRGFPVIGIASTIDNDLVGSDISLGTDTALNVILEALDRIRTTATAHQRAFLVEVMGRDSGYLAMMAGIAGGAELVVLPELDPEPEDVLVGLRDAYATKGLAVVVVAEGWRRGALGLLEHLESASEAMGEIKTRVTILGHVQRGGVPSYFDRALGTRFGAEAVDCLARGEAGLLVGLQGRLTGSSALEAVAGRRRGLDPRLLELAEILAR
jgi:6-phosphofructokinase 1